MATTTWKGFLSFGLISAPVKLYTAARTDRISFNQLHSTCGCRINQIVVCNQCGEGGVAKKVERTEILKGFEVAKDSFLRFTEDEIKAIAPKSSNTMTVERFVDLDAVDPIYFDASYYMVPDEAGRKVYALLSETMKGKGKAAIVKITMHQREHTAIIRSFKHGLTLHTLFYEEEVRTISEFSSDMVAGVNLLPAEHAMAAQLLESQTLPFESVKADSDGYRTALLALIESRKNGTDAPPASAKPKAPEQDLMALLKGSIAAKTPPPAAPVVEVISEKPVAAKKTTKKVAKAS